MHSRTILAASAALLLSLAAAASPSGVVISGFQLRGAAGGNDEYIELRNTGTVNVDISGWKVQGCANGSPGTASNRATVGANIILQPNQYYLFTNNASGGYSGIVPGDATYATGISDFTNSSFAGIQLLDAGNVRQDGVGAPQSPCREGTGFNTPTANGGSNAFVRTRDTDNNLGDFSGPQASNPHASGGITVTCLNDGVRIFAIQGRGHLSPYASKCVGAVPGIVTQVMFNGFYMQDGDGDGDTATSDGVFVFTGTAPTVTPGQQVKVSGNVSEFRRGGGANLTLTEIVSPTVTPSSGLFANAVITPVVIGAGGRMPPNRVIDNDTLGSVEVAAQTTYDPGEDGIDFYESLEGMLVQVNGARVVGPANSFGEIWVVGDGGANASGVNARGGLTVTAGDFNPERIQVDVGLLGLPIPAANVGDAAAIVVGAFTYDFGNYRLLPAVMPAFVSGGLARTTSTVASGIDRLRIASYNVENLDPNDFDTCDGAPDRDIADGRFMREAQQIVGALGSPDILAIEELQDNSGCVNDGTVAADLTLRTLVQAIVDAGGPTYSWAMIDPVNNADGGAPGANIRQAFLHNPARVSLVAGSVARIDPTNAAWIASRKPLVASFDFNARRVTVIANHFNSKGGDDPLFGRFQPPFLDTEAKRVQQAQIVHDFIAGKLAADAGARIVTLGDFNDFSFSAPLRTLTGEATGAPILTSLATALLPPEERYSYVFEGNSQALDHILVSASLMPDAQFQSVHINAEYADQVSDHDPNIASLRILPPPPVANAGADISVTHLTTVTLDGSASLAGDGSALTYAWTQLSGIEVTLTGADTANPTFRAPAQPETPNVKRVPLTFQLTVTDRFGMQASATVTVEVRPGKPGG
jgi:predicted extracellular nuclease